MNYAGSGVITRAGQITLPKAVRQALNLAQGEHLDFYYDEEERVVVVRQKKSPVELFERLAAKLRPEWERKGITREEIVTEVRKVRAEMAVERGTGEN